ncbi:hypothetical protein F4561_001611 [Lipingzhangella halophila]|uniref:Lipoprotein n=1 Tax=Lipingzhangella halophila TaxID=1783352 RepID=A0A7W7RG42_9ACTN|nr:hypothetical protein [Lipingzhangella halophila]MBB4930791.1 hypothetical protein [Lipingzhangella halophila]
MATNPTARPWHAALLCAVLLVSACGNQDEPTDTSAMESAGTDTPTYDPSPEPDPDGETALIIQTQQSTVNGLRIGVVSTSDGEATLSIGGGPGIDEDSPEEVTGTAGDTVTLDNDYTVAFEEIENSDPDAAEDGAGGNGSVKLTVTPPD